MQAELAEKEQDLSDTQREHEWELRADGYEQLADTADEALEHTKDSVARNAELQQKIIDSMLKHVQSSYDTAYKHITDTVNNSNSIILNSSNDLLGNMQINISTALSQIADSIKTSEILTLIGNAGSIFENVLGGANSVRGESDDDVVYASGVKIEPNKVGYDNNDKFSVGQTRQLKATVQPASATRQDVTWTSSNPNICAVDSRGRITAKKFGTATITATATDSNKKYGTCKVKVQSTTGAILDDIEGGKQVHGQSSASSYLHSLGYGDITREQRLQILKEYGVEGVTLDNVTSVKNDAILKEKLQKKLVTDWKAALPKDTRSKDDLAKLNQNAPSVYIGVKYGKYANNAQLQRLADILEYDYDGIPYSDWSGSMKTQLLNKFKALGFSKGGRVNSVYMPASDFLMDVARNNGDMGWITANPGETVLTEQNMSKVGAAVNAVNTLADMMKNGKMNSNISNVAMNITSPLVTVSIAGNADATTVRDLNRIADSITETVTRNLTKEMYKIGRK